MRSVVLGLAFLLFVEPSNVLAQDSAVSNPAPTSPSYLLRLDHLRQGNRDCVLLRGDGQYHFERVGAAENAEIFEGALTLAEVQRIEHIVGSDELFLLSQEKITTPLISKQFDEFGVSVLRPGYWQNLKFPSPESRKPYHQSLDPLLEWLDSLRKGKHVRLSEEAARSNCNPPGEIALKRRPDRDAKSTATSTGSTSPVPSSSSTYTLRLLSKHFANDRAENTCVIIYPVGRYHFERKAQRIREDKVTTSVFEGSVGEQAMQELGRVLDDPELQSRTSDKLPAEIQGLEWEITSLFISRNGHIQRLAFWKYTPVPWFARPSAVNDNGMKALKPLQQWLKANVEETKSAPLQSVLSSNCEPQS